MHMRQKPIIFMARVEAFRVGLQAAFPLALIGLDELSLFRPVLAMPLGVHGRPLLTRLVAWSSQQLVHGTRSPRERRGNACRRGRCVVALEERAQPSDAFANRRAREEVTEGDGCVGQVPLARRGSGAVPVDEDQPVLVDDSRFHEARSL